MTQPALGAPPPPTLTVPDAWYDLQLAAVAARVETLGNILSQAGEDPRLDDPNHPAWRKRWLVDARYRYVDGTLSLLKQRGHVLVCGRHGIDGVSAEEWEQHGIQGWTFEENYAALADRGLNWQRWDEECAASGPIKTTAKQLWEAHRRKAS